MRISINAFFVLLGFFALNLPGTASAVSSSGSFGDAGVIVLDGNVSLAVSRFSPPEGDSASTTTLSLAPGVMAFVNPNFAIGGALELTMVKIPDVDATVTFGLRGGLGFNVPMGSSGSVFPNVTLGVQRFKLGDSSLIRVPLRAAAPFLFHIGNHFLGFGPFLQLDVVTRVEGESAGRTIVFGLASDIGGWFSTGEGQDDESLRDYSPHEPQPDPVQPAPAPAPAEPMPAGGDDDWDV